MRVPELTIMYAEDEESDVFFMRRAFRRMGLPYALEVVHDGQQAIEFLAQQGAYASRSPQPPSLVLLDLNLPILSGFDVLQWIRGQEGMEGLPVILFSSSARPEDRLKAKALGASGYLQKPGSGADFDLVLQHLRREWLDPKEGPAESCQGSGAACRS